MSKSYEPPCSDAAVKAKTGRDWTEWRALLDAEGGARLSHAELARLVRAKFEGGGWWSQQVAVGYERLLGRRAPHVRSDGSRSASTSRTLPLSAAEAHVRFTDARKRARWLPSPVVIRKTTAPTSVRITWPDATSVEVWITAKGDAKCTVAIEHSRLASAEDVVASKKFWAEALEALGRSAGSTQAAQTTSASTVRRRVPLRRPRGRSTARTSKP